MDTQKFIVTIRGVHTQMVEIDAESEEEAIAKVADGEGDYLDDTLEYSHILDPEYWTVAKME